MTALSYLVIDYSSNPALWWPWTSTTFIYKKIIGSLGNFSAETHFYQASFCSVTPLLCSPNATGLRPACYCLQSMALGVGFIHMGPTQWYCCQAKGKRCTMGFQIIKKGLVPLYWLRHRCAVEVIWKGCGTRGNYVEENPISQHINIYLFCDILLGNFDDINANFRAILMLFAFLWSKLAICKLIAVRPLPPGRRRPPRCNAGGCRDCSSCPGGRRRAATSSPSVLQMDADIEAT